MDNYIKFKTYPVSIEKEKKTNAIIFYLIIYRPMRKTLPGIKISNCRKGLILRICPVSRSLQKIVM